MTQFVDQVPGRTHHIEMHDRPAGAVQDVDHLCQEWLDGIAGHDDRSWHNTLRLRSIVEERPDPSGVVDLVDVGWQRDAQLA